MKKLFHENRQIFIIFGSVSLILIALLGYSLDRVFTLSMQMKAMSLHIENIENTLASTTHKLFSEINSTRDNFASAITNQQQNVGSIQQQIGSVQNQVGSLSGTLNTIQKLSQLDQNLLKKYSKVYFLNENYAPANLYEVPSAYRYSDAKHPLILTPVLPRLEAMIDAASTSGISIYTFSAYRSFAEQRALKGEYSMIYGAGTANSFSADQGYSEHQLGTAVDLITPGLGGVLDGFDHTKAYTWMLDNAYKYGFILSYPKNNGYYTFEPWHWRFVGIKLATYLHGQNFNFYDLDQRSIDTYLLSIFD